MEEVVVTPAEPATKRSATDRIREKLLGGKAGKNDIWVEYGGEKYLLVPPKVKQRGKVLEAAMKVTQLKDAEGNATGETDTEFDPSILQARALAACLRDNETRELVFPSPADVEALLESELSPEFDFLAQKAARIINPRLKDVEKNSDAAPGASSSSALPLS